jgi:hypothetical protein
MKKLIRSSTTQIKLGPFVGNFPEMVINNYDFTHINMIKFNNTLIMLSDYAPKYNLTFHLGHKAPANTSLLSCEEVKAGDKIDVYVPDVPTTESRWTNVIKQQLRMIFQVAQKYHMDYISIIVGGTACKEVAAIAIHQTLRDQVGVMYMIEFCMPDDATRRAYEATIPPIYKS